MSNEWVCVGVGGVITGVGGTWLINGRLVGVSKFLVENR